MAMGGFQRNRGYNQENAMSGMSALSKLLGQQSDSFQQVGDSVEEQGQANARGKVADLMQKKEYMDANPEEAQALVQALTGGRKLGDRGAEMLKQTYGAKEDALSNEQKMNAATLLNQRQLSRDAINNKASMSRVNAGKDTPTSQLLTPAQIAEKKEQVRQYDEAMKHPDVANNSALLSNLRRERDTTAGEMIYGATKKPSAAAVGSVTGVDKNGVFNPDNTVTGKSPKAVSTPKSLSGLTRNSSKLENDLINAGYNQGIIKPVPKEYYQKDDPEVKSGKKEKGDAKYSEDAFVQFTDKNGKTHWLRKNRAQIVAYLNKQ